MQHNAADNHLANPMSAIIHFCYVASMYPEHVTHSLSLEEFYLAASAINDGAVPETDEIGTLPIVVCKAIFEMIKANEHVETNIFLVGLIAGMVIMMPEGVGVFSVHSIERAQLIAYERHIFGPM